jgi:hypothetical protein
MPEFEDRRKNCPICGERTLLHRKEILLRICPTTHCWEELTEDQKIIKLVRQLRDEAVRYQKAIKEKSSLTRFELDLIKEYKIRENAHAELLGMLESGQNIEEFLDGD